MGTSRSPPPLFLNSTNFLGKIVENHYLYMGLFRFAGNILVLSLISTLLTCCEAHNSLSTFDVLDYGAVGDGCTDDTIAFVETWKSTCNAETEIAAMLVPDGNTFLVHPMAFDGPCKPTAISFLISGIIIAPDSPEAWKGRNQGRWLIFKDVDGLSVDGPGMIDGRGYTPSNSGSAK